MSDSLQLILEDTDGTQLEMEPADLSDEDGEDGHVHGPDCNH